MQSDAKPRTSRRFRVILALSMALNLLFVGLIAGAVWRNAGGPGARPGGPALESYASPYVRALPRAERRAVYRNIRTAHPMLGRKARREVYTKVLSALRAEPFDQDAVEAVLAGQRAALLGVQEAGQTQWMTAITGMNGAERQAYADRLEALINRPRRSRRIRDRDTD